MKKILIIGNTCVDVIIHVDHLPKTAEDLQPSYQSFALGGCPFNSANIIRQSGVPFLFMTPVGTGMYGDYVRSHISKLGFPIYVEPNKDNGCCYCLVEADGERTFLSYHGVEYSFSKEWMKAVDMSSIDMIYVCGFEIEEDTGEELVSFLEEYSQKEIFFAAGPRLMKIPADRRNRLLALHPILHINEEEALQLGNSPDLTEAAFHLRSLTDNTVVLTLGAKGSCCLEKDAAELFYVPGIAATVRDTIGAGDSHIGQLMASRAKGASWKTALEDANKVSARVVSVTGASLSDEEYAGLFN